MNEPMVRGTGSAISLIGLVLAMTGGSCASSVGRWSRATRLPASGLAQDVIVYSTRIP